MAKPKKHHKAHKPVDQKKVEAQAEKKSKAAKDLEQHSKFDKFKRGEV